MTKVDGMRGWGHRRSSAGRLVATGVIGVLALAAGAAPPAREMTPDEVCTAVQQLAAGANKRQKVEELRRTIPPALLADALVAALASDPAFASDAPTRAAAYDALCRIGQQTAAGIILISDGQVDRLIAGLKEPDVQIRSVCAGALGRAPEPRRADVIEPLVGVLDDESPSVSQRALLSLAVLRMSRPVPERVGAIAFAPTEAMRAKWGAFDRERGGGASSQELTVREAAMNVVSSWEGLDTLVDRDLSKDEPGRTARAIAVGRRIIKDAGRTDIDDRRHGVVIAELAEVLRQPGEARDSDRGAVMALAALAKHGRSDAVKRLAADALRAASETPSAGKRELIRGALRGLP